MPSKVYVIGVGMTKFEKPGSRENFDYPDMAREAGQKALADAGVSFDKIEQAFVGYVYGDSTSGQRAVYELGMTGIPVVNVNNNCSTGSTALYLAKSAIEGGLSNCVLALGFEKMQRGSLSSQFSDRENPIEKHIGVMSQIHDLTSSPMTAQMFGNAGRDYLKKYNITNDEDAFAKIAYKNHKHSVNNPYAQFRTEYSLDDIKKSTVIHEPLTKLQCSPTSDGSAAAILASEEFVRRHKLESRAIEIVALEMATDLPSTFNEKDCTKIVGYDMTQLAAKKAFQKAGIRPEDVQVVELHDCFSANELISYEALGLCASGKAIEMVKNNDNTYGGRYVVNPSGGLISKGHPLGATGIAQCSELCWQLRGEADKRQVQNVRYALQHNIGLGGAVLVGIYRRGAQPASQANNTTVAANTSSISSVASTHKSGKFFQEVEAKIKEDGANMTSKIKAIIGFEVACSDGKKVYFIDLKNSPGSVSLDDGKIKADCTIHINDDDLANIMDGKLNMMTAFSQKKLKLTGNMSIAMKLNQVFSSVAASAIKSKQESAPAPVQAPAPAAPAPVQVSESALAATTSKHKSGKFFEEIEARLKKEGATLVSKVNAIIGFQIACENDKAISYVIDLKNGSGSVFVNDGSHKPGCTILVGDEDFFNIISGKLNMMNAFTQKKVKITGNMSIAMKLNQLMASVKPQSKL